MLIHAHRLTLFGIGLAGVLAVSCSGPAREHLSEPVKDKESRPVTHTGEADWLDGGNYATSGVQLRAGTQLLRDLSYGGDNRQLLDVYRPDKAHAAPILLMVHGGAWAIGDKGASGFIANKTAHWLSKGYILVSMNYRMSRTPNPLDQADDVGRALAFVQAKAPSWGGDPSRVVLLGHSAGAHLVSLVTADPRIAREHGATAWLGTIALDSAAFNLVTIMQGKHFGFYDRVFGKDHAFWMEASPYHRLNAAPVPMLAVCSTRRDEACPQAEAFASKAQQLGGTVTVRPEDLTHGEINTRLGLSSDYTTAVDAFLHSLGLP